ncbi:PD-(D/E)XK nuclease family protein [Noviherbaspirillum denitrificans]|uniref:Helicase I n=1 Tax=Noviherbaspirillum denitrificans TaxID=1968433 RepID=A0A254TCQ1_9BURK|nr:PD-(D/E)XK nuclease family protein [Noviherbaspirillum denitrificans]OWW20335.1 helicase I [Noviherbaspirillum denitrificans]
MPQRSLLIPPSSAFWNDVARALLDEGMPGGTDPARRDFSGVRVLVPGFIHAQCLKSAMADILRHAFVPPRITTMSAWVRMLPPGEEEQGVPSQSERLMSLYAELRQHAWLKKLFSARRNTDLLPLAQVLLALFDELTEAMLPSMHLSPDAAEERWQGALEQLPLPARNILSDEAQLVWTLWKTQLDSTDVTAVCHARMMRLAEQADAPLIWINPTPAGPLQDAFLSAYAERQPVLRIGLDWHAPAIPGVFASAWMEMLEEEGRDSWFAGRLADIATPPALSLCASGSLEEESQRGAQLVVDWLSEGRERIAIIAQDRAVARRIRALLERAQVYVADETGWKLSTTRTAAALAALLDVVSTRCDTVVLLDLLKSPFLFPGMAEKSLRVMEIEHALRRANVMGGWDAVVGVLDKLPQAQELVRQVAEQATHFAGRKSLREWGATTSDALDALGMHEALRNDAAGIQVVMLLDMLAQDCDGMTHQFSFPEWRAFLSLQLESAPFVPPETDRRVVMLQLSGAPLRSFDAVLMVGADADHLPSQSTETLFFANAVRRELGLETREARQRVQLRDFAELLIANPEIVLSWQSHRDGEPNAVSNWIERLQLALERGGAGPLPMRRVEIGPRALTCRPPAMPSPAAPGLLPHKLSASGYNSLVACPYQFFATRMLGLTGLDELSDMPEKRDYGDWLHEILRHYHERLRDGHVGLSGREELLRSISESVFGKALEQSAAALGYYARWQKAIPAYIAWANEREEGGWKFAFGEQRFDKTLSWEGGQVTLHGFIDRIDENEAGERAVLDYKTKPIQSLRDKLKDTEDHQLAFYGLLSDLPVNAAHYVALELTKDKTGDAEAKNFAEWQALLEKQIVSNIKAIAEGAALPANGIEKVCVFCEVRGLCRKGGW